jgi:hypothetical protein
VPVYEISIYFPAVKQGGINDEIRNLKEKKKLIEIEVRKP